MQGAAKRTPRACERCRQTRRRCESPYPCRQCVAAGVPCEVRAKARPQRRQQYRCTVLRDDDRRTGSGRSNLTSGKPAEKENTQPASDAQNPRFTDRAGPRAQGDTFELLKALVQDILLERHGYVFECVLLEPPSCNPGGADSTVSLLAQSDAHQPPPLSSAQTWNLLTAFRQFMGWQDAELIDVDYLHATARTHAEHLSALSPSSASMTITAHRLPVDSVALIFGALALGAVATGEFGYGRFYFGISTEIVKHFVGQPTLDLCLAYFLQHVFALRAGTSNYAQGIIAQAIQNAHDLGLQHNTHGIQGLQLYLLIYMADQYCSLTHNTEPVIRTSKLQGQIFSPLSDAQPQLRTLIELVTINGYVIEHSHQLHSQSQNEILELEAKIGNLCSRQVEPLPTRPSRGSFRTAYEPLARVHMLCCRLKLRAPGLSKQTSWLSSLCICTHAAGGVLSTYFPLYQPVLVALARQSNAQGTYTDKSSTPIACKLATTWRQVKRIMMSAFVIVFAYWHGEITHGEASRYMAMARLLLEYPRWRWGEKLDEALQTLVEISSLSDFRLYENMQMLMPEVSDQFPRPLHGVLQVGAGPSHAASCSSADQTGPHDEAFPVSGPWPGMFDFFSIDGLSGPQISTIEDQTLSGLWETIECSVEGDSWMSNPE